MTSLMALNREDVRFLKGLLNAAEENPDVVADAMGYSVDRFYERMYALQARVGAAATAAGGNE